jgi:hypothetical protein
MTVLSYIDEIHTFTFIFLCSYLYSYLFFYVFYIIFRLSIQARYIVFFYQGISAPDGVR